MSTVSPLSGFTVKKFRDSEIASPKTEDNAPSNLCVRVKRKPPIFESSISAFTFGETGSEKTKLKPIEIITKLSRRAGKTDKILVQEALNMFLGKRFKK